jgi:hypothetical protein
METSYHRWLTERGLAVHVFAREHELPRGQIYKLAGIAAAEASMQVSFPVALQVSLMTGIGLETLVLEAEEAAPVPPRKYSRKIADAAE